MADVKTPIISFRNFSFQYRAQKQPTLQDIYPGERVLIAGPSGSGKSTLAGCVNGLNPFANAGECTGTLTVDGVDAPDSSIFELSRHVGTVLQDPDGQFIGLTVGEDIAFALENDCVAVFNAQKSGFSDEYYFNIYMRKMKQGDYAVCYNARVAPEGMSPMDWQLVEEKTLDGFLDGTVVPAMEWILHTPLQELGAMPDLWINCYCGRHLCSSCWVEKNLWESMEG